MVTNQHGRRAVLVQALGRRSLLRGAVAAGALTSAAAARGQSPIQVWEEGDPQCRINVNAVTPAYPLDDTTLAIFVALSEIVTGVSPLDPNIGSRYLERFATHPRLTDSLPRLLSKYQELASGGHAPTDAEIQSAIMQNADLRPAAEQLIYLWYVSAFFLPREDDPTKNVWVYGSPEQYEQALLWSVIRAHPPMTRGGPFGYWADAPSL